MDEPDKNDEVFPEGLEPDTETDPDINLVEFKFSKNLLRVMDTIDNSVERIENLGKLFIEKRNEDNEKQRKHEKLKSKYMLVVLAIFLIMWIIAMVMGEKEMANGLLYAIMGAAAGAGMLSTVRGNNMGG